MGGSRAALEIKMSGPLLVIKGDNSDLEKIKVLGQKVQQRFKGCELSKPLVVIVEAGGGGVHEFGHVFFIKFHGENVLDGFVVWDRDLESRTKIAIARQPGGLKLSQRYAEGAGIEGKQCAVEAKCLDRYSWSN